MNDRSMTYTNAVLLIVDITDCIMTVQKNADFLKGLHETVAHFQYRPHFPSNKLIGDL